MKTNLLKYYLTVFCFCYNLVLFAQPGTNDNGTGLESDGDTTPAAPIDNYIWVLVTIGLVYVFFQLKDFSNNKVNAQNQFFKNS